ncbi:MAG: RecX family transcriptional regulator, partial [Erysipelotrichaceae bacterium]|nr:RecX family transcriptional regulator [Erysipelotrichaceae bacterium]
MVFLDDDKIMIPVESYFSYGINKRTEIDEDLYDTLRDEEKYLKAYRSCLRKLAMKDHTVRQISTHLKRYDLEDEQKKQIIDRLCQYGMLDDEKYAEGRIAYCDRMNMSDRQIREKLKKDGISEDIISRQLRKDEDREREKAAKLAEKYAGTITNKSRMAKKQAILNKLVSAGYSYEMSRSAVNELDINVDN